ILVEGNNLWKMKRGDKMVTANEKHLRSIRGDSGMVFQHFNLFPHMTVLEKCVISPVEVQGVDKKEAEKYAIEMMNKVGIGAKLDMYQDQICGEQNISGAKAIASGMKT